MNKQLNKTQTTGKSIGNDDKVLAELTVERKLTKLEKVALTAIDDIVKPNEAYKGDESEYSDTTNDFILFGDIDIDCGGDEAKLDAYSSWIKRSSTHRFNLEELRKRIESDGHISAFTIDDAKRTVFDMTALSVNRAVKKGKDGYVCLCKLFDSIAIDNKEGEVYFSFGRTFDSILQQTNAKSFGRTIAGLKSKSQRGR